MSSSPRVDTVNTPLRAEMRARAKEERIYRYTRSLLFWAGLLFAIVVESFALDGWLFSLVLPHWLVPGVQWAVLGVSSSAFLLLLVFAYQELKTSTVQGKVEAFPSPIAAPSSPSTSFPSWLSAHQFGESPSFLSQSVSPRNRSVNSSFLSSSPNTSCIFDDANSSYRAPFDTKIPVRPLPKPLSSIHTKEQLDRLLAKNADGSSLSSSALNTSSLLSLDRLGSPNEKRNYQLSTDIENKENGFDLSMTRKGLFYSPSSPKDKDTSNGDEGTRFRVEFNQYIQAKKGSTPRSILRKEGSRERRMSSTSPLRNTSPRSIIEYSERSDRPCPLTEGDFIRGEQNLRVWMVGTIFKSLHNGIVSINEKLEKEFPTLHLRVGVSTVEALSAAVTQNPPLIKTNLPYLIPYLAVHSNQAYLVSRIKAFASDSCMKEFAWASGGMQPLDDKEKTVSGGRLVGRPWGEHLPTDSQLVLWLFSAYMDARITCNPMIFSHTVDQPFTARFVLIYPNKPNVAQQAIGAFYLHMSSLQLPQLDIVHVQSEGVSRFAYRGPHGLFRAILMFVYHAKTHNDGLIDRLSIGPSGLNIECILS